MKMRVNVSVRVGCEGRVRVRVRLKVLRVRVLRVRVLRVRVLRVSVRVSWGYSLPSTAMKRMHALPMTARSPKSHDGIGAADERRAGRGSPRLVSGLYTARQATVIDRLSATLCFTLFLQSNK